jgi:hypothetical protein
MPHRSLERQAGPEVHLHQLRRAAEPFHANGDAPFFTRLTNGFSKKFENHAHQVALYFMHYNYCRVHTTLRVTPAMEAGLTDHVWTLAELCSLLPERKPNARADKAMVLNALNKTA